MLEKLNQIKFQIVAKMMQNKMTVILRPEKYFETIMPMMTYKQPANNSMSNIVARL